MTKTTMITKSQHIPRHTSNVQAALEQKSTATLDTGVVGSSLCEGLVIIVKSFLLAFPQ